MRAPYRRPQHPFSEGPLRDPAARVCPVRRGLKPFALGLLLGVVGTLLVFYATSLGGKSVPEELESALHCSDGASDLPASIARHTAGYSEWAATHASRIYGIGCDAGPATVFLQFSPYRHEVEHALASIRGFGAVCVVDHGIFSGKSLNGRAQLEELCSDVGGQIEVS